MLRRLHLIAGAIGFIAILSFWTSTVGVELFGSEAAVVAVNGRSPGA